jgi:D-glycero-alpha-D-manno-heptose 1-phosphate guanylyltransferase
MLMLNNATAVVLAGGRGTRLHSVVSDRPKVLAIVNGKPFLTYLLDQIAAVGIMNVVLCVGYRGDQVQAALGQEYAGMRLTYSQETTPLGTGGALCLACPLITSDTFIAMNGDSFCEVNLKDLWEWHHARQASTTMVLTPQSDSARYGRVSLSSNSTIVSFEEKGTATGAGWVNAGIYVFNSEMVRAIHRAIHAVSLEREIIPSWVGQRLYGYQSHGRFLDIGTPESYAQANTFFADKRKNESEPICGA